MELRTQLAIVAAVAVAWSAGRFVRVRSVLDGAADADRASLASLEGRVARDPADVRATRALLRRYYDQGMVRLVLDSARRAPASVQGDGAVSLVVARATEAMGDVRAAQGVVGGALSRCTAVPESLLEGAGCDVEWNVTPLSDPARASVAHEMATRPVRITARVP